MATDVDIANLALAHLGDRATVSSLSPPEGSAQAEHAARFYPMARDALLEMHAWKFATRRLPMADASLVTPPPSAWAYSYTAPPHVTILKVLAPDATEDGAGQPYVVEVGDDDTAVVFTNQVDAVAQYTTHVTDATRFSPLFTQVLSYLLASYMAGPIIKGAEGMKVADGFLQRAMALLGKAAESDANMRDVANIRDDVSSRPVWLRDRGQITYDGFR